MHFRRTDDVLRLAILTAVLTWFVQTRSEAADAVTHRTSIKDHRLQPTELKAPANTPFMAEIGPALDGERGRKALLSRIKQARKFAESHKPQKPIDQNDFDFRHKW